MNKKILGITISDFTIADSSIIIGFGLDSQLNIVAEKSACTKEGCNCVGVWVNGNETEVAKWVEITDFK